MPKSPTTGERRGYSVDEVSAMYHLSRQKVYDEMNDGRLAYLKAGQRRIITQAHLDDWEARSTVGGDA
jgi:hypothetical protein